MEHSPSWHFQLWHLHPVAVHFPIALLLLGLATEATARLRGRAEIERAASWLLGLGLLALWVTLGFGLLAERTAPHVPSAWEVLGEHKMQAFWTAGLFTLLAALRRWLPVRTRRLQLLLWIGAVILLFVTAWHGGLLVYGHGMGVTRGE